jgi:HEAT repeat protein
LVDYLETAKEDGQHALLDYFLSLPKPIHGKRLLDVLLGIKNPKLNDLIIELSGKLSTWEQPKTRLQLLDLLQDFMAGGGDQNTAISSLTLGIEDLGIQDQLAAIQKLLNEQTQQKLLPEWTERCLQLPSAIHDLPLQWQAAAYEHLNDLCRDRDEEKARGALRLLIDLNDESVLETLEAALKHPKSRVRAYAHRQLRKVASKEQYLESTLILLEDKELALRCGAIRTLSFRRYVPAVKGIAEQLFIKKKNVSKVAKAGLLTMGEVALPNLKHVASHARPDQRVVLLKIMKEIESSD